MPRDRRSLAFQANPGLIRAMANSPLSSSRVPKAVFRFSNTLPAPPCAKNPTPAVNPVSPRRRA